MKKLLIGIASLLCMLTAQAQFEQNKWLMAPSITGLGMSYSGHDKFSLGLETEGGVFLVDNLALLINVAATVLSTPPLNPIITFLLPICFFNASTVSVMK